jgi:Zn-dependent protease
MMLIPVILSLTVHEWAHAQVGFWFGDETAEKEGRRTLNPLSHIDPFGTLLLPLLGIPFGWARPVPVDPNGFKVRYNRRLALVWVAAAGPISNLLLALASFGLLSILVNADSLRNLLALMAEPLYLFALINVSLAIFNLIPVPPLDGSKVAAGLLPRSLIYRLENIPGVNFFPLILLLLLLQGEGRAIIDIPIKFIMSLLAKVAGIGGLI